MDAPASEHSSFTQDGHFYFSRSRVETFTDGVFAIIITLLVLELHAPTFSTSHPTTAQLWAGLVALAPKFASWVTSFFIACIIWVNHHRVFSMFRAIDKGLFWHNAHLMLWTTLIPFPTAILGDYFEAPLAVCFFGVVTGMASTCFVLLRLYVLRHPYLLHADVDIQTFARGTWLALLYGTFAYFLGAGLAWVWMPASWLIYALVPVYFITSKATLRRTSSPQIPIKS